MSQHRRHYLDLNTQATPRSPAERYLPNWLLFTLGVALLAAEVYAAYCPLPGEHPAQRPAFETRQITVEEARIEGFRAGVQTAIEQGCSVTLAQPIAER